MDEITFHPEVLPYLSWLLPSGPQPLSVADAEAACRALIKQHRDPSGPWVPPPALRGYDELATEARRHHTLLLANTTATPQKRFGLFLKNTGVSLRVVGALAAVELEDEPDVLDLVARQVVCGSGIVRLRFDLARRGKAFMLSLDGSADGPWTAAGYNRFEAGEAPLRDVRRAVTVEPGGATPARAERVTDGRWRLLEAGYYPFDANAYLVTPDEANRAYATAGEAFDAVISRIALRSALERRPISGLS